MRAAPEHLRAGFETSSDPSIRNVNIGSGSVGPEDWDVVARRVGLATLDTALTGESIAVWIESESASARQTGDSVCVATL